MYTRYISHELRTPLNTVLLGLNLLRSEVLNDDPDKALETIHDLLESLNVATGILNDLLTSDKVSNNNLELECTRLVPWQFIIDTLRPMLVQVTNCT